MKNFVIKYFSFLYTIWQIYKAFKDMLSPKKSYAQYGEDIFVFEILKNKDLSNAIYIDVGANHPTSISNTYLFYKKGHSGILIEPNKKFSFLIRLIRNRDILLPIGTGEKPELAEYNYTTSHVRNSFSQNKALEIIKSEYIPILPLDILIKSIIKTKSVFLLSIDVEGRDYEVLRGSVNLLKRTWLIIIEANSNEQKLKIQEYLINNNFSKIMDSNCNMIFQNDTLILDK